MKFRKVHFVTLDCECRSHLEEFLELLWLQALPRFSLTSQVRQILRETLPLQKQKNKKQEAHGPHRSPEKTVQINKQIWLYHNVDLEKKINIIRLMRIYWFFNWRNWIPIIHGYLCQDWLKLAQWFWRRGFFLILSIYFRYFVIISPWKKEESFI